MMFSVINKKILTVCMHFSSVSLCDSLYSSHKLDDEESMSEFDSCHPSRGQWWYYNKHIYSRGCVSVDLLLLHCQEGLLGCIFIQGQYV